VKSILKTALGTLLGLFIFFLCITGILFIAIFTVLPEKNQRIEKTKSVLQFKTNFTIVEGANELEPALSHPVSLTNIRLFTLIEAIKKAKIDPKIKGISWEAENLSGGLSQLKDLRDVLCDFKKSGKFIYAYGQNFSQKAYYLASVADILFLNPFGNIDIKGLVTERFYYKNLSEKLGIEFSFFKEGKYKSAIETYTQTQMSKEDQQQTKQLLGSLWNTLLTDFSASRRLGAEKVDQITDELLGSTAESAQGNHLVDHLAHYDEFIKSLAQKLDLSAKESVNFIPVADYLQERKEKSGDTIAVLYASGTLLKGSGAQNIQDDYYMKMIDQIKKESSIKAVVIRINSPGGDAFASENLQRALLKLKDKKPLIASLGDYAASGGYYITTAADYIFASPVSVTGSIGVFGLIPNLKKLSDKIGFTTDKVGTHTNSLGISSTGELSRAYEVVFRKNIHNIYNTFIKRVSTGRKIPVEQVEKIAQGRVWSGKDALNKKLIDQLGTLDEAVKFAAQKADLTRYTLVDFPKKDPWISLLKDIYKNPGVDSSIYWEKLFVKKYPELFYEISALLFSDSLQMRLPFKISF